MDSALSFWDISQTPNSISQLPDDDFLALLQKQFPTDTTNSFDLSFPGFNSTGINPQSLSSFSLTLPNASPLSSDSSSPSPPSVDNDARSRRQSTNFGDNEDNSLKRKASGSDDMDIEAPHKAAHTEPSASASTSSSTRKTSSRRKSGNPSQDEVRLMKRKEQNRAAQRAFRERKEKHVKDLEDKVASLEARNQRTESENETLRDLLTRLQEENVQLKQNTSFTFSIPKDQTNQFSTAPVDAPKPPTRASSFNVSPPGSSDPSDTTSQSRFMTPNSSDFSFGSLIPFDPAVLNALDENQSTATDDAMNLDFGFGKQTKPAFNILASDPMYMSFVEPSPSDSTSSPVNSLSAFEFSPLEQWSRSGPQSNVNNGSAMQTLDELFGGNNSFLSAQSGIDFSSLLKNSPPLPTLSPIVHSNPPSAATQSSSNPHEGKDCPKTKAQLSEAIGREGFSSFVQSPSAASSPVQLSPSGSSCPAGKHSFMNLKKAANEHPMVMCGGSSFPKTEQSDKNVEVLSAWRSITSNPQFKDADINELCSEFTDKARCDGTKVVLEPEGVHSIIESLNAKLNTHHQTQRI